MKVLKWILIIAVIIGLVGYFGMEFAKKQTKKHSPEETIEYVQKDVKMSVTYCRPYKKGREIFGELEPYNQVWRTGANEPTTFTSNVSFYLGETSQLIQAGKYSLWTIPQKTQWTIILNSEIPDWGANFDGTAKHNPKYDVAKVNFPTYDLNETVEQLTIKFTNHVNLEIAWDKTKVVVPIMY